MGSEPEKVSTLSLMIDSRLENVVLVSLAIRGICHNALQEREIPGQMELCVVEAVNNAIKHAYDGQSGNEVWVTVTLWPDRIIFAVRDSGRSMTTVKSLDPVINPDDPDSLPESGMGLFIIRSAMDQVDYHSENGWNTLTMTKLIDTHV